MPLPYVFGQFSRSLHSDRDLTLSTARLKAFLTTLVIPFGAVLFVEIFLYRIFSRTSIYLLNDDTPRWVYGMHKGFLWVGNAAYNFSMALSLVLIAIISAYLWRERNTANRFLAWIVSVFLVWNLMLFITEPGPLASLTYLCLSLIVILAVNWIALGLCSWTERIFLVSASGAFCSVYYFKAIPMLLQLGAGFDHQALVIFQIGEVMAGVAILMAFFAWGRTRKVWLLALTMIISALFVGGFAYGPERYPLVTTWALGVTLIFPFPFYAIALGLLGITILNLIRMERKILALVMILLFLGHRMLPLAYFNLLALDGFLLFTIECLSREMREQRLRK